jgi:branched-chain amino acid transport system ATP-binding protein
VSVDADQTDSSSPEDVALETERLTKRFGDLVAVEEVSLTVETGEFRSIIGPNGAGKTTLFNLITGALNPSGGVVRLNGEDITPLPAHERVRRGLGRSFQITNVFPGLTVEENVRLAVQAVEQSSLSVRDRLFRETGSFDDVVGRSQDVLVRIGLADRADTVATSLAYGDRRRLELGIVLATDPSVVLFDEPTAGMSQEETLATLDLVEEVLADRTLLLIEHDIDLVMEVSDRITVLNRGQVLRTGTPEDVADDEDVRRAYLGGVA